MPIRWSPREHVLLAAYFLRWLVIAGLAASVIGVACAVFLWSLEWVTQCGAGSTPGCSGCCRRGGWASGCIYHSGAKGPKAATT